MQCSVAHIFRFVNTKAVSEYTYWQYILAQSYCTSASIANCISLSILIASIYWLEHTIPQPTIPIPTIPQLYWLGYNTSASIANCISLSRKMFPSPVKCALRDVQLRLRQLFSQNRNVQTSSLNPIELSNF